MPSLNNNHTLLFIACHRARGRRERAARAPRRRHRRARRRSRTTSRRSSTRTVSSVIVPGEIAPMSLITYAEVRPWAKGIVRQVSDGVMPPWHADAPHGTFRNERGLTRGTKGSDRAMGRGRCARRGSGGPSAGPGIRVRLADRSAGRDLRDAGGLPRSCERHHRVRALLHPDELY